MKYILTYGIACVETANGKTELIASVPDVTSNREHAEFLVLTLNEHMLPPEHLNDVVEDLLCEI